jgi:hypothetical protein
VHEIAIFPNKKKWIGISSINLMELVKQFENTFKKTGESD